MKRYKKSGDAITKFDSKVAVQLNDTHPTIAIPELMRLFLDEEVSICYIFVLKPNLPGLLGCAMWQVIAYFKC